MSVYIIRGLRREGYSQDEIDLLFQAIVLAKITFGLPVYVASEADLNVIQCFLNRHFKTRYISELLDIRQLLEKSDLPKYKQRQLPPSAIHATTSKGIVYKAKM